MITVSFLTPELKSLDRFRGQALLLSLFEDERPLRGLSGLLDWRSCGMLSRFLAREHVSGGEGEVVLFPTGMRVPVARGLLFGLGPAERFDERVFTRVAERMAMKARPLGVKSAVLALPGAQRRAALDPAKAMSLFADAAGNTFTQLTFVASPGERREMTEELKRRRAQYEIASANTTVVTGVSS